MSGPHHTSFHDNINTYCGPTSFPICLRMSHKSPPVKYFNDRSRVVLFLWIFYVFSVLCLLCLCAGLFIFALWSPVGKRLTSWLCLWCISVNLSLSHWYPGSGVVLDCIDS